MRTRITIRLPYDLLGGLEDMAKSNQSDVSKEAVTAIERHVQGTGVALPTVNRLELISEQIISNSQAAAGLMADAGQKDRDAIRDMLERLVEALIGETPHPTSIAATEQHGIVATGGRISSTPNK